MCCGYLGRHCTVRRIAVDDARHRQASETAWIAECNLQAIQGLLALAFEFEVLAPPSRVEMPPRTRGLPRVGGVIR